VTELLTAVYAAIEAVGVLVLAVAAGARLWLLRRAACRPIPTALWRP